MNWTIKKKLMGIGLLAIAGIVIIMIPTLIVGNNVVESIYTNESRNADRNKVADLHDKLQSSMLLSMEVIAEAAEKVDPEKSIAALLEYAADLKRKKDLLTAIADTQEEKDIAKSFANKIPEFVSLLEKLVQPARIGDMPSLYKIDSRLDVLGDELNNEIVVFENFISNKATQASTLLLESISSARSTIFIIVMLVTLILMFTLYTVINTIIQPLGMMTGGMRKLADQDLSVEIPGVGRTDELGQMADAVQTFKENMIAADKIKETENRRLIDSTSHLKEVIDDIADGDLTSRSRIEGSNDDELVKLSLNLNMMIENLSSITLQIHQATDAMASNLSEVSSAMASQTASASQQAAAINETTSTLSQIKATSDQTLEKTLSQASKAEQARTESLRGNDAVNNAVQGMQKIHQKVDDVAASILELSKKTQQISEITEVVDDLARQSKMLALNASIEAAKAGDSGQGFAVVAEEIRSLAEQSRESTSQVRAILQDIRSSTEHTVMVAEEGTKQVTIGGHMIEDTGKVIAALNQIVKEMAMESQQITAAVRQEVAGVDQIALAMGEISTATNNSVSSVRQSEIAIEDLTRLAEQLKEQVRVYRV